MDRLLAKARLAVVLPAAAAAFSLGLSILFDAAYILAANDHASDQNAELALRLSNAVGPAVAAGDHERANDVLTAIAPGTAVIVNADGDVIAGESSRGLATSTLRLPVVGPDGETVGTLHAWRVVQPGLLIPLPVMVSTTLLISGLAYWLISYFARTTSAQVETLRDMVRRVSAGEKSQAGQRTLVFEEFRRLQTALVRSIRHLRAENARLVEAAYSDERTGLGNSARLTRQLTGFISSSTFEEPAAYILIEAEALQQFSDVHGTLLPNEVHAAMARRLSKFIGVQEERYSMPPGSWPVFALQSDEFAILVDRIGGRNEVMRLVRDVLHALGQPYDIAGQSIRLPARAGIVMIPEDGQAPVEIRKRAESALYQSRGADDVNIRFYSPKLERQTAARKRLESEVRAAVEEKRFVPVFQPKVDLNTGRIVGAEALARWKLESGRIVSPGVFIPVAESTGLIGEIGMQITEQACKAAAFWSGRGFGDVSVAVNVSPLQFECDDLGSMIIRAMSQSGLPPRLLQLEITESVAVSDPERLKDVIGPLKSMGVRLAIDDFGTGHSNLSMLGRLPFDVFKIDRAFISSLYTDKQAPAIVEMILGMAETLGMETVAEGVETQEQENFLRQRGCDQYQGFYYSPPVPLEKFIAMLVADRRSSAANAG